MKIVDLFAGCGGLTIGFHQAGFKSLAFIEWEKSCIATLKENFDKGLETPKFFDVDIRNYSEFLNGSTESLEKIVKANGGVDGIIGGPPCQAYSMAGRVRDPNGMKDDYRNFLFEAYCHILKKLRPKFFVFENVPGILSAKPFGKNVIQDISDGFKKAGYVCANIDKNITYDFADFGGAQKRKRVIIFGVRSTIKGSNQLVRNFYENMETFKQPTSCVQQAIGDLPKIFPIARNPKNSKISHSGVSRDILHQPRFHNQRDIKIFKLLSEDALKDKPKFSSTKSLQDLYQKMVGKTSNVHKYYVLRSNMPSNLIPAHLYKDGLRHIHPDPKQSRSITAREAARLQSFSDDYKFVGSRGDIYKMIGNAVPPHFSNIIARNIKDIFPTKR